MCGRMYARLRVLLALFSSVTGSQVFPSSYFFPTAETMSVNGSCATGNCTTVPAGGLSRCGTPNSSVLFDSNIPTLTGLDEDMWASQLLTLQTTNALARMIDFAVIPGVEIVELVMFNCPEWGIAVQTIILLSAQSISKRKEMVKTFPVPNITSCDSLVRICISQNFEQPVIALEFNPPPGSTWTHLAEVTFYGSGSTCPPDTIITTSPPDSLQDTTTPSPPDTNAPMTMVSHTTSTPPSSSSSSSTLPIIAASISCVVLLIVCLLAAVLILWRCYYVKHHKHNTSHHPAVEEGHINIHSHPPPVTLCEETGQVYYYTPQEVASQDTYSHIHHDAITGNKKSGENTVPEVGEYSMLSCEDKLQEENARADLNPQTYAEIGEERAAVKPIKQYVKKNNKEDEGLLYATSVDQLYAQVDKKKDGDTAHPNTPEADTPVDQLYTQVDKRDGDTTDHPHTPEADTSLDQLYAQVDKKKKKKDGDTAHSHTSEADVDQLYAQVDKKKKSKRKELCENPPHSQ